MTGGRKRKIMPWIFGVAALIGILAAGIYMLVFLKLGPSIPNSKTAMPLDLQEKPGPATPLHPDLTQTPSLENPEPASGENPTPPDQAFIEDLRKKYKNTIHNKWTQTKAIEKLMEYLEKFYPNDWEAHVYDYLKRIFPEMADELYAQFQKNMSYRQWLMDNRQELNTLSREERRDRLWDIRYQIFGEDAYEIWEVELKNEQIYESLQQINEQSDMPFTEKYDVFINSIKQAYGDNSDRFIEKRRQELMDQFLSVESVQKDLHQMPVSERNEKLRQFRKSMGMDEDALKRWDQLDKERDQEWEKGNKYMAAREEIAAKYQGDERDQKLQALRMEYFGDKWADIIRSEEESGFYRFKEQRKLGME